MIFVLQTFSIQFFIAFRRSTGSWPCSTNEVEQVGSPKNARSTIPHPETVVPQSDIASNPKLWGVLQRWKDKCSIATAWVVCKFMLRFWQRFRFCPCAAAETLSLSWVQLNPAVSPLARANFAMAYDPVSKEPVLFGGADATDLYGDTWTFDGQNWTEVQTPAAPRCRDACVRRSD